MEIKDLLSRARGIWAERMGLGQILVRLGVIYGDLCRWERGASKDTATHTDEELKKEMGNLIFSAIRWCDDLGYDPEECVRLAEAGQAKFKNDNEKN